MKPTASTKLDFLLVRQKLAHYQLYGIDYDTSVTVSFLLCIPSLEYLAVNATRLLSMMAQLIVQVALQKWQFYELQTIYV